MNVGMEVTNYCRLCAEQKQPLTYIFCEKSLSKNIGRYLHVQIYEEDSLPHNICDSCSDRIKDMLDFIDKCHSAQRELYRLFTNTTSKIPTGTVKIETEPKRDFDFIDFGENADSKDSRKMLFTKTVPERPAAGDGGPNVIISVTDTSGSNQFKDLHALSKPILRKFGNILYEKHFLPFDIKNNILCLDFLDIVDDLNRFRESLDPLSLQEHRADADDVNERSVSVSDPMDVDPVPFQLLPVQTEPLQLTTTVGPHPIANPASTCNGFTRTDGPSLRCTKCPFDTHQRFRLNQHYKEVHEKPYACDLCEKRFGKESKLLLHKRAEHTDLSPITCPLCSLSFSQKYSYRVHMNKHSKNGSSWTCDHCPETFSHQHKLEVHVARCHKSKSVNCPLCSYIAAHKYQIKQHMREVHLKPIICAICGKRESKKCRMAAHIKSKHMEKTTYECEICTTKYTSKKWFDSHQRKGCPGALPVAKIIQ